MQSFSDKGLRALGRAHSAAEELNGVQILKNSGVNFNIDVMYGFPGQTLGEFSEDLRRAITVGSNHISAYGPTIEPGTEFYTSFKKGDLHLPEEEDFVDMLEHLRASLKAGRFLHYEISNYTRPGFEARHNLAYWNRDSYLGLGAGAHSFKKLDGEIYGERHANIGTPKAYIAAAITRGESSAWREKLDKRAGMYEFFFLGLRKLSGVSRSEFEKEFQLPVEAAYPGIVDALKVGGFF